MDTLSAFSSTIILAAFRKDTEGKRELVALSVGVAETPAVPESVLYKDGEALKGVGYPTAAISAANLRGATEIRAFLWNSANGLRAESPVSSILK